MSRFRTELEDGRQIVLGYDRPMRTWFAQLWDAEFDSDFEWGAPKSAVGYHEFERIEPTAGEYGPYPVVSLDALLAYMRQEWDVTLGHLTVRRIRREARFDG